jgi:hypothetical protein
LAECLFRAIATITIAIQRRHGWSAQGNTSAVAAPHLKTTIYIVRRVSRT